MSNNDTGRLGVALGVATVAAFAAGYAVCSIMSERKKVTVKRLGKSRGPIDGQFVPHDELPESERFLMEEQFSRGERFLGLEGQKKLEDAFVVVVGVGGVGSHCAHFLARSGVRKLRLIDFDNVTLSSLNRHAVAVRDDVGIPKVKAMANHIKEFAPFCSVDCRNQMFTEESAHDLLAGQPDYVVDAIDDRPTKVALIATCLIQGLPLLSSMGAGAKTDPTRVQIAPFRDVCYDPLASRMRWSVGQYLKKHSRDDLDFERVEVIFSSEPAQVKLLPLDDEVAGEDPGELGTVPNFRVRVMPVLGTMPAIFGMAMAARVITQLADKPFLPNPCPSIKRNLALKLLSKLENRIKRIIQKEKELSDSVDGKDGEKSAIHDWQCDAIDDIDLSHLVSSFCQRCAIHENRMGSGGKFEFLPWRYDRPITPSNLVFVGEKAARKIEELLLSHHLPTHVNLGMSQGEYRHIIRVQNSCLTRKQQESLESNRQAFEKSVPRAVAHMNKDHLHDNLTIVQAFGDLPKATEAVLTDIGRDGMLFKVKVGSKENVTARVDFPSRLDHPKEMRETLIKMTFQGRSLLDGDSVDE